MSDRVFVIGDIHGCSTALRALIETIQPTPTDTIITLGDYVDRGPDSRGVLEQLVQLSARCQLLPILGNHETMMMDVIQGEAPHAWLRYGGTSTLDSYGFEGDLDVIPEDHLEFIRSCSDYAETDTHFFVHANYLPDCPLNELDEMTLRWQTLDSFLPEPHMNGKIAVVGHTADHSGEILDIGHLKCIDTFCYGGMWLTALEISTGQLIQTNEQGELRD